MKDWEAGDVIALSSTDYDFKQAERFNITKVSKDGYSVSFEGEVWLPINLI